MPGFPGSDGVPVSRDIHVLIVLYIICSCVLERKYSISLNNYSQLKMLGTELKRTQSVKCEVPIHFLHAKTSAGTKALD